MHFMQFEQHRNRASSQETLLRASEGIGCQQQRRGIRKKLDIAVFNSAVEPLARRAAASYDSLEL